MLDYQNIILDTRSRNSYETSKNLKKIMIENNINNNVPILLVTSPKHYLRMSLLFKKEEILFYVQFYL